MARFEFDGREYGKASKHQKEWGNEILSSLRLRGDESVLDLGCGDGVLTKGLSELVPDGRVIGLDASEGMMNEARKLQKGNLAFVLRDINALDYVNEFDLIFSNAALHWVRDHGKLLANCYKALKDGGFIRFNFAGEGNCSNFYAVVREVMSRTEFRRYFNAFEWPWFMPEIGEYRKLVEASDYKNVEVWSENKDRHFNSEKEMTGWIDQPSIVPFLSSIPDKADQKEFRDAVVEAMLRRTKQKDGTFFETFRRINVHASKNPGP